MSLNMEFIVETIPKVLQAIPITLLLTLFPVLAGLVIGFFLAMLRIRRIPVLSQIIALYLSFFRSVPLLLLLFLSYYGLPKLLNFVFLRRNKGIQHQQHFKPCRGAAHADAVCERLSVRDYSQRF